jgi:hypothetical protein
MNQNAVIEDCVEWLKEMFPSPRYSVRCDHVTCAAQQLGLYVGQKVPGRGCAARISRPDLIVCDEETRTVTLLGEIHPPATPKQLIAQVAPVLLAERYIPSYEYTAGYSIRGTAVVVVTQASASMKSKAAQVEAIQKAILQRFHFSQDGVRAVRICHGPNDSGCLVAFQAAIAELFPTMVAAENCVG